LLERQQSTNRKDVAIVRVEQLNPMLKNIWPLLMVEGAEFCWVQEEPKTWVLGVVFPLRWHDNMHLKRISRESSASPATGFSKVHAKEQLALIDMAFN
jgi:2-oxoglutarate dehydrogenase E1 component